jgi:lipoyl(octanoyl) transferase
MVCEHPPLISVGRQGSRAHILLEPHELAVRGWPVRWVNRAGGCWLHSPGQLAVYSILPLQRPYLDVTTYLSRLGNAVLRLLADFDIHAEARPGGIWSRGRLIAGLGVAVRDWTSYYGLCINVFPRLDDYRLVRCAPGSGEPMTSLERERHGRIRPALVRERLVEHFQAAFGFERVSLFSDHPSLQGLQQRCYSPPVTARQG